jgi:hypothetical protein
MGGLCSAYRVEEGVYRVLFGGRDHWGDPGVDGRIIYTSIFREWDVWVWTGLIWRRIGTGVGLLKMRE